MNFPKILLIILSFVYVWSVIGTKDYLVWFLEIIPSVVGLIILIKTYNRFRFTNFVYLFTFIAICLTIIGARYTYSAVPLFNWIEETFNQSRNNFDKLGHFAQGFLPVLITREILMRREIVKDKNWIVVFALSISIALSAIYEIVEWGVALIAGGTAEEFLGTQGYEWDAQSDIYYAIIGAIIALVFFSKYHNKAIAKLG